MKKKAFSVQRSVVSAAGSQSGAGGVLFLHVPPSIAAGGAGGGAVPLCTPQHLGGTLAFGSQSKVFGHDLLRVRRRACDDDSGERSEGEAPEAAHDGARRRAQGA